MWSAGLFPSEGITGGRPGAELPAGELRFAEETARYYKRFIKTLGLGLADRNFVYVPHERRCVVIDS